MIVSSAAAPAPDLRNGEMIPAQLRQGAFQIRKFMSFSDGTTDEDELSRSLFTPVSAPVLERLSNDEKEILRFWVRGSEMYPIYQTWLCVYCAGSLPLHLHAQASVTLSSGTALPFRRGTA